MKGELFFLHNSKDGMMQRLHFAHMGAFVSWLKERGVNVLIEVDGDVMIIRDQ